MTRRLSGPALDATSNRAGAIFAPFLIIAALLLGPATTLALAQVLPAAPKPAPPSPEVVSAQRKADDAAVVDCEAMWDRGTHMTRQEWSRTCRRMQDRLRPLQGN